MKLFHVLGALARWERSGSKHSVQSVREHFRRSARGARIRVKRYRRSRRR